MMGRIDFTPENVQARYKYAVKNQPAGQRKGFPDYIEKLRNVVRVIQKMKWNARSSAGLNF